MLNVVFVIFLAIQPAWKLQKDEQGIEVYTRSLEGSSLDEFKGITTIPVTVADILEALRDVDSWVDWVPGLETAQLISLEGNEQYHYTENDAPFPVQNRDSYVRYRYLEIENGVCVEFNAIPDYGPKKEGKVRVPFAKGFWLLESISETRTRVTYQVQAQPGGSVPDWLANAGSVDTPYYTLTGLRDYVLKN